MPQIYGIAEIAKTLGERRQTVAQWHKRGRLPSPTEDLAAGPVWTAAAIEPWIAERKKAVPQKEDCSAPWRLLTVP